ncbi:MAG: hypothetical protein AMXMBFR84_28780 [Candidatus Hydrogenedentota bacterium]
MKRYTLPAKAQFEPIAQLLGIFQTILAIPNIFIGQGSQIVLLLTGVVGFLSASTNFLNTLAQVFGVNPQNP